MVKSRRKKSRFPVRKLISIRIHRYMIPALSHFPTFTSWVDFHNPHIPSSVPPVYSASKLYTALDQLNNMKAKISSLRTQRLNLAKTACQLLTNSQRKIKKFGKLELLINKRFIFVFT